MIRASVINSDDEIKIEIAGHSGYAPYGNDIVCAGISALFMAFIAFVEKSYKGYWQRRILPGDGYVYIRKYKALPELDIALKVFVSGVEEICENYPENVVLEVI